MAAPALLPNIAARLQAMIDSLQSNANITVTIAEIGPPATAAQIRNARKAALGQLPPGLEEFYSQVGYFKLEWTYTGPKLLPPNASELSKWDLQNYDSTPRGLVDIIPITQIFGSWAHNLYFPEDGESGDEYDLNDPSFAEKYQNQEQQEEEDDDDDEDDAEDWRFRFAHLKPIDRFVPEAYTVLVGPKKQKKSRSQKFSDFIAYHYCGEELVETKYTFADYVERLLISRGYWYWVTSLCHFEWKNHSVDELKGIAPQIFPDMDLSLLIP
ncbi:hypothetical protein BJX63DRAFT_273544 [Aspergillus granulosus]|uniref:Knr4/Smi1-like domain-containing protein n=1 Tax=Aspergillus granulosus TaxID=176169 RepID=A0ABR4H8I6_9EURO